MHLKKSYYFSCSYPLGIGSIVLPGNWGRIIKLNPNQNEPYIVNEGIIETLREYNFPDRPSRLKCIFLCETIDELEKFVKDTNRIFDIGYRVELVLPELGIFKTDWKLITSLSTGNFSEWNTIIFSYWQAENIKNCEILTLSPIKIKEVLFPAPN